jgi:hypothetical protein
MVGDGHFSGMGFEGGFALGWGIGVRDDRRHR